MVTAHCLITGLYYNAIVFCYPQILSVFWWGNDVAYINALYWTENMFFFFGEVFSPLDILKPYAVENKVIPTGKLDKSLNQNNNNFM